MCMYVDKYSVLLLSSLMRKRSEPQQAQTEACTGEHIPRQRRYKSRESFLLPVATFFSVLWNPSEMAKRAKLGYLPSKQASAEVQKRPSRRTNPTNSRCTWAYQPPRMTAPHIEMTCSPDWNCNCPFYSFLRASKALSSGEGGPENGRNRQNGHGFCYLERLISRGGGADFRPQSTGN